MPALNDQSQVIDDTRVVCGLAVQEGQLFEELQDGWWGRVVLGYEGLIRSHESEWFISYSILSY